MEFWLSTDNHTEKFQLPVNPPEFRVRTGNKNETVNVVDLGDINLPGGEELMELEIACFFPARYAPYCAYRDIPDPYNAVKIIDQWRREKRVVRLIITDTDINFLCLIESFEYGERGGVRDVQYILTLREYRVIALGQVVDEPTAVQGVTEARPVTKPKPKTYTVKPGDNLSLISKRVYGDSGKWRQIYDANKSVIGPDPNLIRPGQQLVIP